MNSSTGASRPHTPANAALQAARNSAKNHVAIRNIARCLNAYRCRKSHGRHPTTPEATTTCMLASGCSHLDGAPGSSHVTIRGKHRYPTRKCSRYQIHRGMQKAVRCTSFQWRPPVDSPGAGPYSTDRRRNPRYKDRCRPGWGERNPEHCWNRTRPSEPRVRTRSDRPGCRVGHPECHPAGRRGHHPGTEIRCPRARRSQESPRHLVSHPHLSPDRGLRPFRRTPLGHRGRTKS